MKLSNDSNDSDDNSNDCNSIDDKESLKGQMINDFLAIPVRHCLFCQWNFDCLEDTISHMTEIHGFFVPFEKSLKSLHGLLIHGGKSIRQKHQCVWSCNYTRY